MSTRRPARSTWLAIALLAVTVVGVVGPDRFTAPPGGDQRAPRARDTVVRVVDGDTVVLRAAGKSRLIGVDTPEVFGRRGCFGDEASEFAKKTLPRGLAVTVERDAERRDRYGRNLIYLTLPDGRSFNELLVRHGFAVPLTIAPNVRHAARFREIASRARDRRAGLWSPTTCDGHVDRFGGGRTRR